MCTTLKIKKKKSNNNSRVVYYNVSRDGQSQRNGGQPEFKKLSSSCRLNGYDILCT